MEKGNLLCYPTDSPFHQLLSTLDFVHCSSPLCVWTLLFMTFCRMSPFKETQSNGFLAYLVHVWASRRSVMNVAFVCFHLNGMPLQSLDSTNNLYDIIFYSLKTEITRIAKSRTELSALHHLLFSKCLTTRLTQTWQDPRDQVLNTRQSCPFSWMELWGGLSEWTKNRSTWKDVSQ